MRHPFDGIIFPERDENPKANPSRRDVLRLAGSVGPALVVAGLAGRAAGQQATTLAVGEEGGKRPPSRRTTKAIGEEGGRVPPGRITTMAVGEEGGKVPPSRKTLFQKSHQAFEATLKDCDIEGAAKHLRKLTSFARMKQYKSKVADARKRLGEKLADVLVRADADLKEGKLVEAVKAYRALSRIGGFPEQNKARKKQLVAAKLDGYKQALREVLAQEKYDAADGKTPKQRLAILLQVASLYPDTPTGKKAAEEAKKLAAIIRIRTDTTEALGEKGGKNPSLRKTTKAIGEEGGKGGRLRATTMAVGEEG